MKNLLRAGLLATTLLLAAPVTYAQISVGVNISANIAPPAIPTYVQPPCPVDGYLWQPGYWAYDPASAGYYWVPGVWIAPPTVGYLWTPCYWGYDGGVYVFHQGYWGPHVGFYGGINYGYGYFGSGFSGGGWQGGRFRYNTAVVHVNTRVIHNTYVDRSVVSRGGSRVSYNGGRGGVTARPRPQDQQAMRERHVQPTSAQQSHQQAASRDRSHFASVNHGSPAAATNRVNNNRSARTSQPANRASNPRPTANNRPSQAARTRTPASNPAAQRGQRPEMQRPQQPQRQAHQMQQQPHMQAQPRQQQPQHMQAPRPQAQPHGGGGGGEPHGGRHR